MSRAFEELARIVDDLLITVENEGGDPGEVNYVDDNVPLYYRDWNAVFTDCGLTEVDSIAESGILSALSGTE